jgi:hypothetical protein
MTRTYLDFNTTADAINGLLAVYEQHLRRTTQVKLDEPLQYELSDVITYLSSIADLSCLVYNDT